MLTQTEARIYLESQRGCFQTKGFRSFQTFNFEGYQADGRDSFGKLCVVNDETLLAQCTNVIVVEEPCQVILLPLVGGIEVANGDQAPSFVDSGEAFVFTARPGDEYLITNPYSEEAINYLQIRADYTKQPAQEKFITRFDLTNKNTLLPVCNGGANDTSIFIGKYEGREEGVFVNEFSNHGIFTFIIEGAFEVQNRLLEKRDGLSVRGADAIEFEALSNDAVILIVQI